MAAYAAPCPFQGRTTCLPCPGKSLSAPTHHHGGTSPPFSLARYSSYASSYQESNCHRLVTEPLLYEVGVDLVLNGHVHAYERTWPVHNWTLDDCGPMHIILGDGGNVEKLATQFVDSPGACDGAPKHGSSFSPLVCPQMLYDGKFCPPSQPAWSAMRWVWVGGFGMGGMFPVLGSKAGSKVYHRKGPCMGWGSWKRMGGAQEQWDSRKVGRTVMMRHGCMRTAVTARREPAFGFGTLDILNETHALYAWQRTGPSGPGGLVVGLGTLWHRATHQAARSRSGSLGEHAMGA